MAVVAAGKAQQRRLLAACVLDGLYALGYHRLRRLGADGAVHIARLAEAAAAHAAAEQLQIHPVVDDLRAGHYRVRGIVDAVQILHYALGDGLRRAGEALELRKRAVGVVNRLVQAGHIHALDLRRLQQEVALAPALVTRALEQAQHLHVGLLALAEHHEVHERRHRLRVAAACTPGKDQRHQLSPVLAPHGQAGHVQHVQHRAVGHLVAYGEAQHVKFADRVAALQRVEWDVVLPHGLRHVAPRGKHALAPDVRLVVYYAVEYAHAQVGHAYLVNVREAEGHAQLHSGLVLDYLVVLPAGVSCRLLHCGQYSSETFVHTSTPFLS